VQISSNFSLLSEPEHESGLVPPAGGVGSTAVLGGSGLVSGRGDGVIADPGDGLNGCISAGSVCGLG